MITDLQQQKSGGSSTEAEELAQSLIPVFESAMNNDLDVKTAFDNLYETINEIHEKRVPFSVKNTENLMNDLHRIDSVLQCLF
jgi:cysteinyl-tRNA synthetase